MKPNNEGMNSYENMNSYMKTSTLAGKQTKSLCCPEHSGRPGPQKYSCGSLQQKMFSKVFMKPKGNCTSAGGSTRNLD